MKTVAAPKKLDNSGYYSNKVSNINVKLTLIRYTIHNLFRQKFSQYAVMSMFEVPYTFGIGSYIIHLT